MLDWLRNRLKGEPAAAEAASPLALYEAGRIEEAQLLAQQRLAANPDDMAALYVQGRIQLDTGQPHPAMAALRRVVEAHPDHVDAWVELARASVRASSRKGAEEAFERARALRPDHPRLLVELALQALATRQTDEAHNLLARLRKPEPRSAEAFVQLAGFSLSDGRLDIALRLLRRAVEADPQHAEAHANLGAVLRDLGQPDAAVEPLRAALAIKPGLPQAAFNLGMVYVDRKDWPQAVPLLEAAAAGSPRDPEAHYWLGNALMGWGDCESARQAYHTAVRLKSNHLQARWGETMAQLPAVSRSAGEQEQALVRFRQELDRLRSWFATQRPAEAYIAVGAQQPFYLAYTEKDCTSLLSQYGQLCATLMEGWARKSRLPPPESRGTGGVLRVGIVSAHVHGHSVWDAVLRGWIEHLDPKRFELHLFHTGSGTDDETKWAERRVESLHRNLGDWTAWAKAISDARFDVLLYPEIGMDATTVRLSALRLARMQVASWGHPITTGLPTMDAYLSAEAFEPPGRDDHYTERLIALPRLGCAYQPYDTEPEEPDLASWGVAEGDRLLVCAGQPFKYAPRDDAVWVAVARRCQPCKLLFFAGPDDLKAKVLEHRLRGAFAEGGVDFEATVRFIPWLPRGAFFGLLGRADVFLDTIGFSGFNTAMQAVQCGTPIVAWEGQFMRGRFASAILRQMGLDEFVAGSAEAYVALVQQLCNDPAARDAVRKRMWQARERLYDDSATVEALGEQLQLLASRR